MSSRTCPFCGAELKAEVFGGLCPRCVLHQTTANEAPPPAESPLDRGSSFGDYELLEEIARGGMGVVYCARQKSLDRLVAVKVLLASQFAKPESVQHFHTEAAAIAHLQHPNIIAIHEVGEHKGQPYFSMDYVEGRTLAEIVRERPVPAQRAAAYLKVIAEAVHYAHQHDILHRDLKPSNVLIDATDQPRITDFGLAKRLTGDAELTLGGQVVGSPNYLSPEQAAGKHAEVGRASDVYALGAMLYHLMTGRPPFQADSVATLLRQVIETEPVAPRILNPSIPRDLETICLKCLGKEPARRYASAQAVADELGRFLEKKPILARPARPPERVWLWCRRRPVRASLIGALVIVALAGAAGVLWQWREAELARRDAIEKLWRSYLAEAHASRWSNHPGRRFDGLTALSNAAAIRPSPELRNEAIACLTLPDVQVQRQIKLDRPLAEGDSLVFDARFKQYARIDENGSIHVCQASDDRELFTLPGPGKPDAAYGVFSPDGRFFAERFHGSPTNRLLIWNLARRDLALTLPMTLRNLAFTPDSRQLAAVETSETNAVIHFYDPVSGKEVRTIALPQHIGDLSFDPLGRWLAVSSAAGQTVRIIELESQAITRELAHLGRVRGIAWSGDGACLAVCSDLQVYLWDMRHAERKPTLLEGHTSVAWRVMFNQAGDMLASYGWDGMTRFWDPKAGRLLVSLPGEYVPMNFAPDDRAAGFVLSHSDLGIWKVDPARECRRFGWATLPTGWEGAGHFSPDRRLLATVSLDGVRIWNVSAGHLLGFLPFPESRAAIFHPDGRSLIVAGQSRLERWRIEWTKSGAEVRLGPAQPLAPQGCQGACLSPDGHTLIVTQARDADVLVIDLQQPGQTKRLMGHRRATGISISPDGQWFATGTWKGEGVKVWDVRTGQPIKELPVRGNAVCAFSPDSRWLITGSAEEYVFWKSGSWERVRTLRREGTGDMSGWITFSPDGSLVALLHDRASDVKLLAVADGRELATLDTGKPLCFSPDGSLLATAALDERSLLVWDLRTIRHHLATMKLDWDLPPMPAPVEAGEPRNISFTILTNIQGTPSR